MELKVKKIKPVYTKIITTAVKYEEDVTAGSLLKVKAEGALKEYQKVISVGNMVRLVKPGDVIMINPKRYAKRKHDKNSIRNDLDLNPIIGFDFPIVTINGIDYLMLDEQDIEYIIEEYEEIPSKTKPVMNNLIVPKPEIIV